MEESNKSLSSSTTTSNNTSWRIGEKTRDDTKLFGAAKDKDRREGGFGHNRHEGPPSERRSVFSRGNDERKGGAFGSRDNDRGGWSRGGNSSGGAFDKSFKDGPREGGRTAFDRDTPRKREIPASNDQVN